jgi:arylsulfatase A-like enzyme
LDGKQLFTALLLLALARAVAVGSGLNDAGTTGQAAERPNVLWITVEDMSPNLGSYGDSFARTPTLDMLAGHGVRYTRAFATAPVCSPARSCLITGRYATSLGTQRLRSRFPIPPQIRAFSALLRDAGYYCTNNVKTDYNVRDEAAFIADAWNDSSATAHWRRRTAGQPFFAVFNLMTTHQSRTSVWPREQFEREIGARLNAGQRHDPAAANLPPYYPDRPEARAAWARYHDCITHMDGEVAELLQQLDSDGLAADTIVFFFSDHGMGMPRGKRVLYDSGLQVPLLIRFPGKWQHLAPAPPGETVGRLVSFVDFAPTMLSLCGVRIPESMQGSVFLGPAAGPPRTHVYGARDRVDEAFDVARCVRGDRWLYVRNFMPHLSWMQPEGYSDASTFRRELTRLARAGALNADQLQYAGPRRAIEELYDTAADPHQLRNLADTPAHRATLELLRGELHRWQLESRDLGFLTEPQVWQRLGDTATPWDLARDASRYPLAGLIETADLVGRTGALSRQARLLRESDDDGVRYWAALGLRAAGERAGESRAALRAALGDPVSVVRTEAAAALVTLGDAEPGLRVLGSELRSTVPEEVLHAARALQLLGDAARPLFPAMADVLATARARESSSDIQMFIRFSLEAALQPTE